MGGLAGCLLLAGVLSGCTTARNNLGTTDSSCYLALPTATKAVDMHGRMIGLHRYTLGQLRQRAPHLFKELASNKAASQQVCVVAFAGTFEAGSVSHPLGRSSGRVAVVVATSPYNHLLGTVIFKRAPLLFGHTHIG